MCFGRRRRIMQSRSMLFMMVVSCTFASASGQSTESCSALADVKIDGVEITKAAPVDAGTMVPPPYPGAPAIGPLPAHSRADGVINPRKGVDGEDFGSGCEVVLP